MIRFKNTINNTVRICLFGLLIFAVHGSTFAKQDQTESQKPAEVQTLPIPPIKRIVLYNSGVGQLQHEASVTGKQKVRLNFSIDNVSDALKSLVISDDGGGSIKAIEYKPAPDPADIAAETIGRPMTVAQLLQSQRGEVVNLSVGSNSMTGKIYGVEQRMDSEGTRDTLVLLNHAGLRTIDLATVGAIDFEKQSLREQLILALEGTVRSKLASEKPVDLLLDGKNKRTVQIAYVVDMPIWRMSYRLSLDDEECKLQGWAHVDNATGVDWNEIALDLRSGKPQTFHTGLFNPIAAERTDVGTSIYEFLDDLMVSQQTFESRKNFSEDEPSANIGGYFGGGFGGLGGGGLGGGGSGGVFGGGPGGGGGSRPSDGVEIERGFEAGAESQKVAQMVRYRLQEPISLGAGESAALPVFEQTFPAKKVSVINVTSVPSGAPHLAVELTNNRKLAMLSGPISLMQAGDFVGDGSLARTDAFQKTLVRYGVDTAVEVSSLPILETNKYTAVRIKQSKLVSDHLVTHRLSYSLKNLDTEDRTIILNLRRPKKQRFPKFSPAAYEEDGEWLKFEVAVAAGESKTFDVDFTRTESKQTPWIDSADLDIAKTWREDGVELPESDQQKLLAAIEINGKIRTLLKTKDRLSRDLAAAYREETRARNNLDVNKIDKKFGQKALENFQKAQANLEAVNLAVKQNAISIEDLEAKKRALVE